MPKPHWLWIEGGGRIQQNGPLFVLWSNGTSHKRIMFVFTDIWTSFMLVFYDNIFLYFCLHFNEENKNIKKAGMSYIINNCWCTILQWIYCEMTAIYNNTNIISNIIWRKVKKGKGLDNFHYLNKYLWYHDRFIKTQNYGFVE